MRESLVRKKTVIIIAAAVLLAGIGFTAGMMAKSSLASGSKDIGVDAAKEIALASVGVSAEKATFTEAVLEEGSYEIGFYTQSNEYDFAIDAATGAIVNRETSPRDLTIPEKDSAGSAVQNTEPAAKQTESAPAEPSTKPANENNPDNDDEVIGVSAAKQIALKHAGLSSASFQDASLDYDDGTRVYDIDYASTVSSALSACAIYLEDPSCFSVKIINCTTGELILNYLRH